MRIAFVAEYPASPERVVGGVQATVRRLASEIARRAKHEVHAISFESGRGEFAQEEMEGVRVHRFPLPRRLGNVTLGWAERRETAAALRRIDPDVAHAHVLGPPALGTADSGIPWVVTAHGIQTAYGKLLEGWAGRVRAWAYTKMEQESLRRTRHLIVISPYVLETFADRLDGIRVHAIDNPVEERFFRVEGTGDPTRILVSGRVVPLKDPETMIAAAAILAKSGRPFTIHFAGPADEDSYVATLTERVRNGGLSDHVRFLGSISPEALAREMGEAGLLVLPSLQETSSLAIMEAMASGRPVVATATGGNAHLVEAGKTGWLVPTRNPERLASAIAEALGDAEDARARGRRGREIAERRFRTDSVVSRTLEVYDEVLAESGVRAA